MLSLLIGDFENGLCPTYHDIRKDGSIGGHIQRGKKMRDNYFGRPTIAVVAMGGDGKTVTSGRQVRALVGPDDETRREQQHTPRPRRDTPRPLDEIFTRT